MRSSDLSGDFPAPGSPSGAEADAGAETTPKETLRQFFRRELLPVLETFESRRKEIVRNLGIIIGVVVVLALGAAALFHGAILATPPLGLFILIPAVGLIGGAVWWYTHEYRKEFKTEVIGRVVTYVDPSLRYRPEGAIGQGDFQASRLFTHRIDRYRGEDLVRGKLGKTEIAFSEVHAEYKTESRDSKGHRRTSWHTIFKGLYFIADFNKDFAGLTLVVPDVAERLFGKLGQMFQSVNVTRPGELVKLEDPEFEKVFAVYGSDQVEARYILSTALMQRLLDFTKKTKCPVHISFVRSQVHVAITTGRDLFEPKMLQPATEFGTIEEYFRDLSLATGIVEDLNLNRRIWTKR
jgi:hypothetical protein